MNSILKLLAAASVVGTAAAQGTCGVDYPTAGTGAVTDAACEAQTTGHHYNSVNAGSACAGADCDLTVTADMTACCEETKCTGNAVTAKDHTCAAGSKLKTNAGATAMPPGADPETTCCVDKEATDCLDAAAFCPTLAGTSTDPCISDCATCVGFANLPETTAPNAGTGTAGAYAADIAAAGDTCGQSICTPRNVAGWATGGIAIAGIGGSETTVAELLGAVSTEAGYTRQVQQTAGKDPACGGTATDTTATPDCAAAFAAASNTLAASCPAGCDYSAIECRLGSVAVTEAFVVTPDPTASVDAGGSANKCVLPAAAATGYAITGLTCGAATTAAGAAETTTGTISCAVPHTCVAATHHPRAGGAPGSPMTAGDISCPVHGGELTLANCAVNECQQGAPPTGYLADGANAATQTIVGDGNSGAATGQGEVTCDRDPNGDGDGNYVEADDGYHGANPAVSCLDADGLHTGSFTWTGCSQLKCNDISGDLAGSTDPFTQGTGDGSPGTCSTGMTIKANLAVGCADPAGCTTNDCCIDDDGCAPPLGLNGVDDSGGDDGQDPCLGTDSTCTDVVAPGTGNTCTCNDGFFGAVATSSTTAPVAGSCTPCTPIANTAVDTACSVSGTTTCANTVTCTAADNSRAVAFGGGGDTCVTGAIHVDNTASGVSDVCRLECPFTELVALIDQLHTTEDKCAVVSDAWVAGALSHQVETAACEAVPGCYYIPKDDGDDPVGAADDTAAICAPIYAACKLIAQNAGTTETDCGANGAAATTGHGTGANGPARVVAPPTLSGDGDLTTLADNVAACTFDDPNNDSPGGTRTDDTCLFTPPASAYVPITRCDALLATGWAHDLRDSCDATAACPLHGNAGDATPGMVAMLKLVYTAAGAAPDIACCTSNTFTDGTQTNYFTNDGNPLSKSFWDVCTGIRDAVLAAPTCSSGAGR